LINQANARLSSVRGTSSAQLPKGKVTLHPGGAFSLKAKGGTQYEVRSNGTLASFHTGTQSARFFGDGRIASVHTAGLEIRNGLHGERTVVSRRPDGSTLVTTGPHTGYLERRITAGGHSQLVNRTYVTNGLIRNRFYAGYQYYGVPLQRYLPHAYFAPAFYGWAYYPWATPLAFNWGWAGAPWFGYYHGYFTPYNLYPSGYAWLTDYYLSDLLSESFSGNDGAAPLSTEADSEPDHVYAQTDTPITPELKNAIAEEVQQQLSLSSSGATGVGDLTQTELPAAIRPDHVFVVSTSFDVTTEGQEACSLSAGDVLQLSAPPRDGIPLTQARVASSKRADCPAGAIVSVSLQSLQDMQNDLRANVEEGLTDLHDNQGRDGWPKAPAAALAAPPHPAMDGLPGADSTAAGLLVAQRQEAAQAESNVMVAAFSKPQ
jgi:hypothetical protein